jgi:hypothetical protein
MNSLPQYGFGPDMTFEKLVESNPFLFRVYSRHSKSPELEREDPFFLGAKFDLDDEPVDPTEVDLRGWDGASDASTASSAANATYADAIRHLDWTKRSESPYISTSFSFAWAVWEASRRYQDGLKHDVQIAVIDARAVMGRAITALELLRQGNPAEYVRSIHSVEYLSLINFTTGGTVTIGSFTASPPRPKMFSSSVASQALPSFRQFLSYPWVYVLFTVPTTDANLIFSTASAQASRLFLARAHFGAGPQ